MYSPEHYRRLQEEDDRYCRTVGLVVMRIERQMDGKWECTTVRPRNSEPRKVFPDLDALLEHVRERAEEYRGDDGGGEEG